MFQFLRLGFRWISLLVISNCLLFDKKSKSQQFLFVLAYHELVGWPVEMPQYYVDQLPGIKQGLSNLFNMNIQFTCFSLSCV